MLSGLCAKTYFLLSLNYHPFSSRQLYTVSAPGLLPKCSNGPKYGQPAYAHWKSWMYPIHTSFALNPLAKIFHRARSHHLTSWWGGKGRGREIPDCIIRNVYRGRCIRSHPPKCWWGGVQGPIISIANKVGESVTYSDFSWYNIFYSIPIPLSYQFQHAGIDSNRYHNRNIPQWKGDYRK